MHTHFGKPCKFGHTLRYKSGGCVECTKIRGNSDQYKRIRKLRKQSERGRALVRVHRLHYVYGVTASEYSRMLTEQQSLCAICKVFLQEPNVDHNHITGEVRGLLCRKCNSAIGLLQDSATNCRNAAAYLDKYQA